MKKAEDSNVVPLQVVTGGKSGGHNWLSDLNRGSVFFCRMQNAKEFDLNEFQVVWQWKRTAKLACTIAGQEREFPVDTERFSGAMELVEVIHEGTNDE